MGPGVNISSSRLIADAQHLFLVEGESLHFPSHAISRVNNIYLAHNGNRRIS